MGIRCAMYLDDGIFGSVSYTKSCSHSLLIQNDLKKNAGLTVNILKSDFTPSQTGRWLGFDIDTRQMKFSVPTEKIRLLLVLISKALKSTYINAKQVAKIAGHLISMTPAIGPLTRLFTRQMYRFVENRTSWYNPEVSDNLLKHELLFWERNLINNNGHIF